MQAEFASRNLWTYLREEEFSDETQVTKMLSQYVRALLQVAIRGYGDSEREPLSERPKGPPPSEDPPRAMSPTSDGTVTLRPFVQTYSLTASVELAARNCGVEVRNIVELEDLAAVTRFARIAMRVGHLRVEHLRGFVKELRAQHGARVVAFGSD